MRLAWKKSQKTLDINKITLKWDPKHRECGQTKHNGLDSQLGTTDSGMGRYFTPRGSLWDGGEIHTQGHHLPQDCWLYWDPGGTTYHRTVGCIETQGAPPTTGLLAVLRPRGHHLPQDCWLYRDPGGTTYHTTVGCIEDSTPLLCREGKRSFITDHPPGPCRVRVSGAYFCTKEAPCQKSYFVIKVQAQQS